MAYSPFGVVSPDPPTLARTFRCSFSSAELSFVIVMLEVPRAPPVALTPAVGAAAYGLEI